MQFVDDDSDIPDSLLQADEDGRVVFFCSAGIQGLVDAIYRLVGTKRTPIKQEAYNRNQFDATLDLLERRFKSSLTLSFYR